MDSLSLRPTGNKTSVHFERELAGCSAIVVDSDNTSRSILTRQLRDFGFADVVQHSRIETAREVLAVRRFDAVLCAQYCPGDSPTGQDLLDDLRRDGLLPFSTVFIMVTMEASYAKVEQAAESSLDAYLLKPHSAANLVQRLLGARRRKEELADIFIALEQQQMAQAITLCLRRFEKRAPFWMYCARLGAELMLRTARYDGARALCQAVTAATGEPWARAGMARALLSVGQFARAIALLKDLTQNVPDYADAYDVLGRAQLKLGQLDAAIESYRKAGSLTPSSTARLQRLGMLAFYHGDAREAENMLEQALHLGQESRSFDYQTLALLALLRAAQDNWPGVQRCREVAHAMLAKAPERLRLRRVARLVDAVALLQQRSLADATAIALELAGALTDPEFDFDLACNLLSLLALLAREGAQFDRAEDLVSQLGHRYCMSDATTALLQAAARTHEPYVERIRGCNEHLLELSELAMKLHLQGDHRGAIDGFLELANTHMNARLFDAANQLFLRHADSLSDAKALEAELAALGERAGVSRARPGFGDSQGRPPAGVVLRIAAPLPAALNSW